MHENHAAVFLRPALTTTLRYQGGASVIMLDFPASAQDFSVRHLTLDFNNNLSAHTAFRALPNAHDFDFSDCSIINMRVFGVAIAGAYNFRIERNYIKMPVPSPQQNEAISVFPSTSVPQRGLINANHCDGSGMDIHGNDLKIVKNVVHGHKFGGGITTEADDAICYNLEIIENTVYDGTGKDVNDTWCPGIENWARDSIISGNICHNNAGEGIAQTGRRCVVTDNICYDNGNGVVDPGPPPVYVESPGISIRYADETYNASESLFAANRCFDTRSGSSKTQAYGIADGADPFCDNVTIGVNNFLGNKDGLADIHGSNYSIIAPLSGGAVALSAPSSAPTDGDLNNSNISFYLDQSGNNLKVRVKYSNGTLKTATIALS